MRSSYAHMQTTMQGILKPKPRIERDDYSQITDLGPNSAYNGSMQYHQQPQQQQQHSQTHSWPGVVQSSPYYPNAAPYATPSQQPYATPSQPSSTSQQSPYSGYNLNNNNTYSYPTQSPTTAVQYQNAGLDEEEEPDNPSAERTAEVEDVQPHEAHVKDLDELCAALQAHIDANTVDGVSQLAKAEISLHQDAFVPLLRPAIGPYANGGAQDLPEDFKKNFPEDSDFGEKAAREGAGDSQTQDQSRHVAENGSQEATQEPDQDTQQSPTQQDGDRTASQPEGTNTQPQKKPTKPPGSTRDETPLKNCPRATVHNVLNIADGAIRAIVQRAASRGIVQRITQLDGFKYMFNNYWTSHNDNDGMRFSYICRDSLQNKDRAAHVPARASTNPPVHARPMLRKGKHAWDCRGTVCIKFSSVVGHIFIQYRHAAIHPTHASRKRTPRASQQRKKPPGRPRGSTNGGKRKRDDEQRGYAHLEPQGASVPAPLMQPSGYALQTMQPAQREPSLFELLQQSAVETAASNAGGQLGSSSSPWWANS